MKNTALQLLQLLRNRPKEIILLFLLTCGVTLYGQNTTPTIPIVIAPTCDYTAGNITLTTMGGTNASGQTTQYVLTDKEGIVLQVSSTPSFTNVAIGGYIAYAISYETAQGISNLSVNSPVQNITGGCLDFSNPFAFTVCPAANTCTKFSGDDVTITPTGGNTTGGTLQYIMTDATGTILRIQSSNIFTNISNLGNVHFYALSYDNTTTTTNLTVNNSLNSVTFSGGSTACFDWSAPVIIQFCAVPAEICNNGIDDDFDGDTDCADSDCNAPSITSITPNNPTLASCPNLNNGFIVVNATGVNLEYSIDGTNFQASNTFSNLTAGNYTLTVRNSVTGCTATTNTTLTAPICTEICNNGIDDDGDSLVDCNDPDCGQPTVTQLNPVNPTIASCPNLNNGIIVVDAIGTNLEYSSNGTNFQQNNTFSNLTAGTYTITVRNSVTGCSTTSTTTLTNPTCPVNPTADLPIIPNGCTYTGVTSVNLTVTGGSTGVGETTAYALTDANGNILQVQSNSIFNNLSVGGFAAYAIKYETSSGINNLSIGNNIQSVTSNGCLDFSAPFAFTICPSTDDCDYFVGQAIDNLNQSGGNTTNGTVRYILTDSTGIIEQIQTTLNFTAVTDEGRYVVYALAYDNTTTVNNLTIGNSINGLSFTGTCYELSSPYFIQICTVPVEDCTNGIDDDFDGLIDCDDPDCKPAQPGPITRG